MTDEVRARPGYAAADLRESEQDPERWWNLCLKGLVE